MSNRPRATPSHPFGTSTGAKGASTRDGKISRAKRHSLSPYPIAADRQKHMNKQGFPNTAGKRG